MIFHGLEGIQIEYKKTRRGETITYAASDPMITSGIVSKSTWGEIQFAITEPVEVEVELELIRGSGTIIDISDLHLFDFNYVHQGPLFMHWTLHGSNPCNRG